MKANPDKCHFICSNNDKVNLIVENQIINNNKCEKLLGVKFDYKWTFNAHIDDISKKAELKLHTLSRIAQYMNFNKKMVLSECNLLVSIQLLPFSFGCVTIAQKIIK